MAYEAIIARVSEVRPLEGSDRIKLAIVSGYQIIVGLDVAEGQVGILLEAGGKLSDEMAKANDLVRRKDEQGNPAGGMFEESKKVKAIKLRGAKSEGFFGPLSLLSFTGYDISKLKEGDRFSELNGVPICSKYYTPATMRAMARGGKAPRTNNMFAKHMETDNIKKTGAEIPRGSILHLSEKIHGTSGRYSHVMEDVEIPLNKVQKFFHKLLKKPTSRKEWIYLYGSRNVVLGKPGAKSYYEDEGFRINVMKDVVLRKGEVVYGEIVGWEAVDKPIMGRQDLTELKNKALEKRFGKVITYSYGQLNGTAKFYVYRITSVNEDGVAIELSKVQVDQRAKELGLSVVPHVETLIYDGDFNGLLKKLELLTDGEKETPCSRLDSSHLQEGIVVRAESEFGTKFYKSKSISFLQGEGLEREDPHYVDTEEAA